RGDGGGRLCGGIEGAGKQTEDRSAFYRCGDARWNERQRACEQGACHASGGQGTLHLGVSGETGRLGDAARGRGRFAEQALSAGRLGQGGRAGVAVRSEPMPSSIVRSPRKRPSRSTKSASRLDLRGILLSLRRADSGEEFLDLVLEVS